jgi:transcriptional regulator with GAF, ATPase, and Fis domain
MSSTNGRSTDKRRDRRIETRCIRPNGHSVELEVLESYGEFDGVPAVIGTVLDITARRRTDEQIIDRLQFERLLADYSTRFIKTPSARVDPLIDEYLKALVEFLGNDRSTLVEFGEDERHVQVTHSYAVSGLQSFPLGPLAVERLPWFIGRFRSGHMVFVRNVEEELPAEAVKEREYCKEHGVKSNIALPLIAEGVALGGLTFAFMSQLCVWPDDIVTRLQLVADVIANALMRRRSDATLRAALDDNKRLQQQLADENQYLREQTVLRHHHAGIVGRSDGMLRVLSEAERVAATDAPVLLLGETGTGKELLAQTIHELSRRKRRTMVIVNCASLPATLVESELFGREAGAYTGAASAQVGRFAVADHSTLFLDEVGELPIELQAKLLRVLQDGRFERLGSSKTVKVNVRVIAATNRDLAKAVEEGRFRADLYHRLSVFPIRIPPLRERRDDIPDLVWSIVESLGRRMGKSIKRIPRKTLQELTQYSWPGNVRELSNVLERAMILTSGDTLNIELPTESSSSDPAVGKTLHEIESAHILRILKETGWRIRGLGGAAGLLGIKPTTLEARMARLGIRRPTRSSDSSIS